MTTVGAALRRDVCRDDELHAVRHRVWKLLLRSKLLKVWSEQASDRARRRLAAIRVRDAVREQRRRCPVVVPLRD